MCGIVAIFGYGDNAPQVDREELRTIRDSMINRGPDGKGEWFSEDGRVGLGHRRLAIIDLSKNGAQPMKTRNDRFVVTFNGEIYNYRELRESLKSKGYVFESQSDTEVLLHLYADRGRDMVHDLRGMFSFALWDATKKGLLIARDPYGIKPLYYADDRRTLRIASQVKALRAGGKISNEHNPAGLVGFFLMGSVPEPHTLYRDIHALPAGSTMWIDEKGCSQPKKYFSIAAIYKEAEKQSLNNDPQSLQQKARNALLDSVRCHFVSDVPVGIFLSSGVDSGSLVGLARDAGFDRLQTITLAFKEFHNRADDESLYSEDLSRIYETQHSTRYLSKDEFEADMKEAFHAMDQPSIDGLNTYFVSKAAAEKGLKVVLSGIGGDELLGGYSSFKEIPLMVQYCRFPARIPFLGKLFQMLYASLGVKIFKLKPKGAGLLTYGGTFPGSYFLRRGLFMPWELESVLDKNLVAEGLRELKLFDLFNKELELEPKRSFARITTLESSFYLKNQLLRDTDWAGMAHSVEIRTPYIDSILLKHIAPVLLNTQRINKKYLLYQSVSKRLPHHIVSKRKTGFLIPINEWLPQGNHETSRIRNWSKNVYQQFCPEAHTKPQVNIVAGTD